MNKNKLTILLLTLLLVIVSSYIFLIHIPYFNHENNVNQIRNEILEKNKLDYDNYVFEYNGAKQIYVLRVKQEDRSIYIAANSKGEIQATYSSECFDQKQVKKQIMKTFKVTSEAIGELDVAYENNLFCYYKKIQKDSNLLYVYYNIQTGEFIKSYDLRSDLS